LLSIPLKSPPNLTNLEPESKEESKLVLKLCSSKWAREERVEGAFIPPHTKKSRYSSKTRNVREKPGNSGMSGYSGKNTDTPAFQG
jgi:hypothetical protein